MESWLSLSIIFKKFGSLAQLVEQRPFKARVAGSIPAALTRQELLRGVSAWGPIV